MTDSLEQRLADVIRSAVSDAVRDALGDASAAPADPVIPPMAVGVREAADALSVSEDTVRRMVAEGRLRTVDLGTKSVRIPRTALEALCANTPGGDTDV